MGLDEQQIKTLIQLAITTTPDDMDCDGCCERLAEFAEAHLANQSVNESMRRVENHLQNCHCCWEEFEALRLALVELAGAS